MSFSYTTQQLTDASRQFRLLQISRDLQSEPIRCQIISITRITAPKYIAVSYTWGDENEVRDIFVNGGLMTVRQNCFYALWQLRFHGFDLPIWIDSICIDQSNNLEKSKQVRQMGSIYANAQLTVACLGQGVWLHDVAQDIEDHSNFTSNDNHEISYLWKAWDHLSCLANVPYFKRLWIAQELYHSKEIVLLCGQDSLPWYDLQPFFLEIAQETSKLMMDDTIDNEGRSELDETELARYIHFRKFRLAQLAVKSEWTDERTGHGFTGVLLTFGDGACFNPRDKIYGLLSLAQDSRWLVGFPIDYNRSLVDVLLDVVTRIGSESLTENASRLVAKMIVWFNLQPTDVFNNAALQPGPNQGPSVPWSNFVTNTVSFESIRVWRIHNLAIGSNITILQANNMVLQLTGGMLADHGFAPSTIWHQVCMARGRILRSDGAEILIAGPDVKPGDLIAEFNAVRDDGYDVHTAVICRAANPRSKRLEIVNQATTLLDLGVYDQLYQTTYCRPSVVSNLPVFEKKYLYSNMMLARSSQERAVIHLRPMDLIKLVLFQGHITGRIHFPILSRDTKCFVALEQRDILEESTRTLTATISQAEYLYAERRLQLVTALRSFYNEILTEGGEPRQSGVTEQTLIYLDTILVTPLEQQAATLRLPIEPLDNTMLRYLNQLIRMRELARLNALQGFEASVITEAKRRVELAMYRQRVQDTWSMRM